MCFLSPAPVPWPMYPNNFPQILNSIGRSEWTHRKKRHVHPEIQAYHRGIDDEYLSVKIRRYCNVYIYIYIYLCLYMCAKKYIYIYTFHHCSNWWCSGYLNICLDFFHSPPKNKYFLASSKDHEQSWFSTRSLEESHRKRRPEMIKYHRWTKCPTDHWDTWRIIPFISHKKKKKTFGKGTLPYLRGLSNHGY